MSSFHSRASPPPLFFAFPFLYPELLLLTHYVFYITHTQSHSFFFSLHPLYIHTQYMFTNLSIPLSHLFTQTFACLTLPSPTPSLIPHIVSSQHLHTASRPTRLTYTHTVNRTRDLMPSCHAQSYVKPHYMPPRPSPAFSLHLPFIGHPLCRVEV